MLLAETADMNKLVKDVQNISFIFFNFLRIIHSWFALCYLPITEAPENINFHPENSSSGRPSLIGTEKINFLSCPTELS